MHISESFNNTVPALVSSGLMFTILLVWTWSVAYDRGLAWWHALFGLFIFTGTVYVMTLPGRHDPDGLWRARAARAFKKPRYRFLLGLLTFYMTIMLIIGASGLLMLPFVGTSWVHYYQDGREVKSLIEALPSLPAYLLFAFIGGFHFALTRRRVKELVRPAR